MKGSKIIMAAFTAILIGLTPAGFAQERTPAEQVESTQPRQVTNINADDAETIAEVLDGVGMARARAIVEYREENGPFASVEELTEVSGIGEKTLIANSGKIRLD